MYGYVLCDADTLQWGEFPDCVGKQLLLLLLLYVSPFTKPVTKVEHSEQPLTQRIILPWPAEGQRATLERSDLRSKNMGLPVELFMPNRQTRCSQILVSYFR